MSLLINIGTAWLTVVLMVLLTGVYLLRLWIQKGGLPKDSVVRLWNRKLRKTHKWIGIFAVLTGLVHGIYSSASVLSPNKGTLLWVVFILLGLSWMLRKKLSHWHPWIKVHRILAVASLVLLLLHILEVGGFIGLDPLVNALRPDGDEVTVEVADQVVEDSFVAGVPDGTYEGTATGFRPGLVVSVKVKDGRITEVVVIEHNEQNERYWGEPVERIPKAIVEAQSTEVDIISGATFTSIGIMDAVDDALKKALETTEEKAVTVVEKERVAPQDPVDEEEVNPVTESEPQKDGEEAPVIVEETDTDHEEEPQEAEEDGPEDMPVEETAVEESNQTEPIEASPVPVEEVISIETYTGSAMGYDGMITVEVELTDGVISDVRILSHEERVAHYWRRPVELLPGRIVAAQSTEIDVISSATVTSQAIIKAVEDALKQANR